MNAYTAADPTIAVITIVSGRHDHLRRQLSAMRTSAVVPGQHVVVAMDDPDIETITMVHPSVTFRHIACSPSGLELAKARNLGAQRAIDHGADLLIFLDVDCIPAPGLIQRYREASRRRPYDRLLWCGPVTYLSEEDDMSDLARSTKPHPARPDPSGDDIILDDQMSLFWSLSFAVRADDWKEIGGFHTGYRGYGGEDTDFAMAAQDKGFRIGWVGGAHAYHQWHPVSDPPVEHLEDILRNATLFHRRWGWWPMRGWLDAFEKSGLISYESAAESWQRNETSSVR